MGGGERKLKREGKSLFNQNNANDLISILT